MSEPQKMQSETLGKLAEALAKAQGAMSGAKKDSLNPHFNNRYADLAAVWDACREPLASNGLAVVQAVESAMDGVTVVSTLLHSSGEFLRDRCWLPVVQKTPQGYGSTITYARRYSLAALVGVAQEDDDAEAGSRTQTPSHPKGERAASRSVSAKVAKEPNPPAGTGGAKGPEVAAKPEEKPADQPRGGNLGKQARLNRLWLKAKEEKVTPDQFSAWRKSIIGDKAKDSVSDEDLDQLEVALPDLLRAMQPATDNSPTPF